MFAFHLHFGFYSKSSKMYFRVLKMSFNSWQFLNSFFTQLMFEIFYRLVSSSIHFKSGFSSTADTCPDPAASHIAAWSWTWNLYIMMLQWIAGEACRKITRYRLSYKSMSPSWISDLQYLFIPISSCLYDQLFVYMLSFPYHIQLNLLNTKLITTTLWIIMKSSFANYVNGTITLLCKLLLYTLAQICANFGLS
jgi:hypothetical protein